MKQSKIFVAGGIAAAVIISIIISSAYMIEQPESDQSSAIVDSKVMEMEKNIDATLYTTIKNASSPSLGFDYNSGTVYSLFTKTANNQTDLYMITSNDGGKTFSEQVRVNQKEGDATDAGYTYPISFGPNGEIFVAWQVVEPHPTFWGIGDIRLARSYDGGKTFGPTIKPTINEPLSEKYFAELAVSKTGEILIPYINNELVVFGNNSVVYDTDEVDYKTQLYALRSEDDGKTFHRITLDDDACQCCDNASTVGPDGEIYITYRDSDRKTAQPKDYSDPYITNQPAWDPDDAEKQAIEEGLIQQVAHSTVRDIMITRTVDNGKGLEFSKPVDVQDVPWYYDGCPSTGSGLQFDSNGSLHVVYMTGEGNAGGGYYYTYSDDKGDSFSDSLPVYTADYVPVIHINPDLAVDSDNNIWMTFVTGPDYKTYEELHHTAKIVHVFAIDSSGNLLEEITFPTKATNSPDLSPSINGALLSYVDEEGVKIVSLLVRDR